MNGRAINGCWTILWTTLASLAMTAAAAADEAGVRIRLGIGDKEPSKWDGTVTVDGGRVTAIHGWRFANGDRVTGTTGWVASTRRTQQQRRSNQPARAANAQNNAPMSDNGVILLLADATDGSRITVQTPQGTFTFTLADIPYGKVISRLEGKVDIERVAPAQPLTGSDNTDDDFPAAAAASDGTVYVAYVSFTPGLDRSERARSLAEELKDLAKLATPPGGDQLVLRVLKHGKWSQPLAVTPGKGDIYKCAVAVDGHGGAWVVWSEMRDGNFDLWTRSYADGKFSEPQRLTTHAGHDHSPVATTDAAGRVWIAWQGARDNVFRILSRRQTAGGWTDEQVVSTQQRNCWAPAIAAEPGSAKSAGRVAIAWDTYEKGEYDIYVREFDAHGQPQPPRPAANSPRYEARPALTYDQQGNLWVAYEESGETWGKNFGALVTNQGIPLYRDRQIGLRVLSGGQWMEPQGDLLAALPDPRRRRGMRTLPVPTPEPQSERRVQGREAQAQANAPFNNISRLACDRAGRIWLLARTRLSDFRSPIGSVWMEYAAYSNGDAWVGPILLPHSDNLLYNVPAVALAPDGGLLVAHSTDHRQNRRIVRAGMGGNAALDAQADPFINDVYVTRLVAPGSPSVGSFKKPAEEVVVNPRPGQATLKEWAEVERCRSYRATVNGKTLRILRGEFHRHTEISGDGGGDGPLEDMWRYAIDVAAMDWLGCGDHDNGAGREYPWWLTQKTTDAYHLPGSFDSMFSYERSVRYPEGHRNVIFAYRGVRTLPRLPISSRDEIAPAPDTQMLYKYLRHFNGICAVHTSATSMGTDWRDNDPVVEPFVEIYQGCRQNYERPGAPRSPTADDAIGGWEPAGFVNLALKKGYRLAFQSSSDHRSTHISYALVYAPEATRQAIFDAMKVRHVYAATENIIADYRCTSSDGVEHMLGDEFSTAQPPTLRVKLVGTAPFAKVVIVKDDEEIHTIEPKQADVEFTWTDPKPTAGNTSYYYVRGEQADGELVWVSPMWISYQPEN
jgi:hypothetical protein